MDYYLLCVNIYELPFPWHAILIVEINFFRTLGYVVFVNEKRYVSNERGNPVVRYKVTAMAGGNTDDDR